MIKLRQARTKLVEIQEQKAEKKGINPVKYSQTRAESTGTFGNEI